MSESVRLDRRSQYRRKDASSSASDAESPVRKRDRDSTDSRIQAERRESDDNSDDRSRKHRRDRDDQEYRRERQSHSSRKSQTYRDRSDSRERSHHRKNQRSRSPPVKKARHSEDASRSPRPDKRSRAPLPSQHESFHGTKDVANSNGENPPIQKEKPNYKPTGLLAKEANTVAGTSTILKYHEPPEGRKPPPKEQWRMYVFKKKDLLDTIYLYERSVWLFGRDQNVTDLLLEHPSISKQHAVIQFRSITTTNEFGDKQSRVKPYLLDLDSAHGTKLNGKKIEASRYVELVDGDVVAFGDSEREYVMMLPPKDK